MKTFTTECVWRSWWFLTGSCSLTCLRRSDPAWVLGTSSSGEAPTCNYTLLKRNCPLCVCMCACAWSHTNSIIAPSGFPLAMTWTPEELLCGMWQQLFQTTCVLRHKSVYTFRGLATCLPPAPYFFPPYFFDVNTCVCVRASMRVCWDIKTYFGSYCRLHTVWIVLSVFLYQYIYFQFVSVC